MHPSKGTHGVANIDDYLFVVYGRPPPKSLTIDFITRFWKSVLSEKKIQGKNSYWAAFCLFIFQLTKFLKKVSNQLHYIYTILNIGKRIKNCLIIVWGMLALPKVRETNTKLEREKTVYSWKKCISKENKKSTTKKHQTKDLQVLNNFEEKTSTFKCKNSWCSLWRNTNKIKKTLACKMNTPRQAFYFKLPVNLYCTSKIMLSVSNLEVCNFIIDVVEK